MIGIIARRPSRHFADDKAFLPAALAIVESPPSPMRTGMIVTIAALFTAAIGWACVGRMDIVSVAPGKLQPQGRVKTIQSVETGRVATLDATNGSRVKAGDVLFTLDPAPAQAQAAQARIDLVSFKAEATRRAAAIASMHMAAPVAPAWSDDVPAQIRDREERVLRSSVGQLRANVARLEAVIAQKRAERDRLDATIIAESTLVGTLQQRVDMRTTLMNTGAGAKAAVIDAQEAQQTQATALATELGQRTGLTAAVTIAQAALEKAYADFGGDNEQRRAEAERQADDASERLARAQVTLSNLVVTTPIAGTVQGSSVTTLGQVVTVGEQLMRVVPVGAPLEVDAYLPNREVGFVHEGQDVEVKVDAFPFTRYGSLRGKIVRLGQDAIPAPDADAEQADASRPLADRKAAGGQSTQDLVFPVTVSLDDNYIMLDGRRVTLFPGMSVSAEIKTGSRPLIDYILSPIEDVSSSAMHER